MELLALQDQVYDLTKINEQLHRLLEKEKMTTEAFVNPPEPTFLECCSQCVQNRTAFVEMRQSNQQDHENFILVKHKCVDRTTKQLAKITELEAKYSALQIRFRDLEQLKTDPFCRDSEIIKLRGEAAAETQRFKDANRTAFLANVEAKQFLADLKAEQERSRKLEIDLQNSNVKIQQLQDTIEAYKQVPELKDLPVGLCKDFRCTNRYNETCRKLGGFDRQVSQLKQENEDLQRDVKRQKSDNTVLMARLDKGMEALSPVFMVLEQSDAPIVADFDKCDDYGNLRLSLKTFFIFFPAHDEEYEESAMYTDFLLDFSTNEQRQAIIGSIYAACHGGRKIPESILERFRQKSTDTRPELVCRKCFAACMIALGGHFQKKGNKTVWRNVQSIKRSGI